MKAKFTHQVLIGLDPLTHEALERRCNKIFPPQSKSAFCREAIIRKLITEFPQAFQKPEIIAAE
jgi:hypothetical protein